MTPPASAIPWRRCELLLLLDHGGGRTITYPGDDPAGFERNLRQFMPTWMAFDMRLMSERFLTEGMLPEAGDVARLTQLLGRPLRSYRNFLSEMAIGTL